MKKHYHVQKQSSTIHPICQEQWNSPVYVYQVNNITIIVNIMIIKTDSIQSSSNYLQKLFTKNLLTAR